MKIIYRILKEEDINAYREIRLDCLRNHPDSFGSLYEIEMNSNELKFDKILRLKTNQSFLFGAFIQEELIAICGFTREERIKTKHRGKISHMYVKPVFEGKGIGKGILKNTLDEAFADDTLEIIDLGVVKSNEKAIRLYTSFGFEKYGQFEKYFKYKNNYWSFIFMDLKRENYGHNR